MTQSKYEPRYDKTNKVNVRPAKTQISLGIRPVWSESSLSAWRKHGFLATHWAHSEDWSDWADAQADLSLRWAHNHIVGFVMSRLIRWFFFTSGSCVSELYLRQMKLLIGLRSQEVTVSVFSQSGITSKVPTFSDFHLKSRPLRFWTICVRCATFTDISPVDQVTMFDVYKVSRRKIDQSPPIFIILIICIQVP